MIGMGAVSVGSAITALYGGMKPITGTNPMAFGIPARGGKQIILDFATASMSMGEIQKRVAKKEPIPDGVMLDGHGQPTTDFKTFRGPPRGVFLPFGGYKGSGVCADHRNPRRPAFRQRPRQKLVEQRRPRRQRYVSPSIAVEEFQELEIFTTESTN